MHLDRLLLLGASLLVSDSAAARPAHAVFAQSPLSPGKPNRVYGDNEASFCADKTEQLMHVSRLDFAPWPPVLDRHLFLYMQTYTPQTESMNSTNLTLTFTLPGTDYEPGVLSYPLAAFPFTAMRTGLDHVRTTEVVWGHMEFVADYNFPSFMMPRNDWHVKFDAVLQDGRTVFCFESDFAFRGHRDQSDRPAEPETTSRHLNNLFLTQSGS